MSKQRCAKYQSPLLFNENVSYLPLHYKNNTVHLTKHHWVNTIMQNHPDMGLRFESYKETLRNPSHHKEQKHRAEGSSVFMSKDFDKQLSIEAVVMKSEDEDKSQCRHKCGALAIHGMQVMEI